MTRAAPNPNLLSLVVPVYNEVESLPALVAEIDAATKDIGLSVEILFIDDGSNDGSWDVIRDLSAKSNRVQGYRFRRNFGKAAALSAGFKIASGSIVTPTTSGVAPGTERNSPARTTRTHALPCTYLPN